MLSGLCILLGDRTPKASTWGLQTLQLVRNVQYVTNAQAGAICAGSTFKWDSTDSELHIPCGRHIQAKYWAGSWPSRRAIWLFQVDFHYNTSSIFWLLIMILLLGYHRPFPHWWERERAWAYNDRWWSGCLLMTNIHSLLVFIVAVLLHHHHLATIPYWFL